MTFSLENIPNEPPKEVEQVVNLETGEIEKLNELPVMYKAQQLFSIPYAEEDSRYRSPDLVEQFTPISTQVMSFIRDKEKGRLTYRRLIDEHGAVIKSTQVVEFCDPTISVPTVITCDRYPDGEVPADMLRKVEDFIDDQGKRITGEI